MSYLKEFREDAKAIYEEEGIDAAITFAAERILESYNNGKEAGAKGTKPRKPRQSNSSRYHR